MLGADGFRLDTDRLSKRSRRTGAVQGEDEEEEPAQRLMISTFRHTLKHYSILYSHRRRITN